MVVLESWDGTDGMHPGQGRAWTIQDLGTQMTLAIYWRGAGQNVITQTQLFSSSHGPGSCPRVALSFSLPHGPCLLVPPFSPLPASTVPYHLP
jgi:hypothetical protein